MYTASAANMRHPSPSSAQTRSGQRPRRRAAHKKAKRRPYFPKTVMPLAAVSHDIAMTTLMSFDFDLTAPFMPEFSTRDQHEHRHKIRPVQIIAPSSLGSGRFRLNESALNSVLGHAGCANKKVIF
ncbi:unnamed protein product [Caenorhabditis auriculariae]|uniref:Uncharacterized protein n=1 Tax=Caenorhabditis auriculariae TaxID=2777116 RepID=A0A8S1HVF0_9PELO|nr:unnamed protein product [Caenorhabditis auriculariae]